MIKQRILSRPGSNDDMKLIDGRRGRRGNWGIFLICNLQRCRGVGRRAGGRYLFFQLKATLCSCGYHFSVCRYMPLQHGLLVFVGRNLPLFFSSSFGVMGAKLDVLAPRELFGTRALYLFFSLQGILPFVVCFFHSKNV